MTINTETLDKVATINHQEWSDESLMWLGMTREEMNCPPTVYSTLEIDEAEEDYFPPSELGEHYYFPNGY